MDIITHALSGVVLANIIAETPEQKICVVIGSILPDVLFSPFFPLLSKKAGKKLKDLSEKDFLLLADTIQPWRKIYQVMHGIPMLILVSLLEVLIFQTYFLCSGMALHIFYDLWSHKYKTPGLNPKPFFPFSSKPFNYGFINGWESWPKINIISWVIHLILIYLSS